MMNILAIIPARGGSKGIPMKNIKKMNGKPLISYTIEQSLGSKYINRTLVNSDSREIRMVAKQLGAEVMDRVEEFCHDNTTQEVDRLLCWIIENIESEGDKIDVVVLLYPTAPLRRVTSIDEAIKKVVDAGYDSVLSLYEDTTYLWKVEGDVAIPCNYNPKTRGPRQKEEWNQWAENKAIYVMKRDLLMSTKCRLGGKIGFVKMNKLESIDIDKHEDFKLCESLMEVNGVRNEM